MQQSHLEPCPFVNAEFMARHMNRTVRLVGQLVEQGPDTVTLRTSDNQNVVVRTAQGSLFGAAEIVEVTGVVQGPQTLTEVSHVDYTQSPTAKPFDMANYDKLVQFSAQFAPEFM